MRTFRTALLAAAAVSAGVPALVHAQDAPQDRERFRDHGEERGDRGARGNGGQRPDRAAQAQTTAQAAPQPQPQAQPAIRAQDVQRQAAAQAAPDRGDWRNRGNGRFTPGQAGNTPDIRAQQFDNRRDDRRGAGFAPGRPDDGRRDGYGRPGSDRGNAFQRQNNLGRPGGDWRGREWRQDRRYDWRGFRDQNRSLFRASRYYAPRGWAYGYRRFDIGYRLPPFLFGSQYWIADPWAYRLPPVEGPYRWVRYYNDVLLIDLRSGEVVDEIADFFW